MNMAERIKEIGKWLIMLTIIPIAGLALLILFALSLCQWRWAGMVGALFLQSFIFATIVLGQGSLWE